MRVRALALVGVGSLTLTKMGAGAGGSPGGRTPERMRGAVPRELAGPVAGKGKPEGGGSSAEAVMVDPQPELGKVFFTVDGTNYVCSGTATDSANRDVVTTAGTASTRARGLRHELRLRPGLQGRSQPLRHRVAESTLAPGAWVNSGDFNHDVGFAVMAEQDGQCLTDVVGPIRWRRLDHGRRAHSVNSFGYRGEKDVMYGPYFGDVEQAVYSVAANS